MMTSRIKAIASGLIVVLALAYCGWLAFKWTAMRVYVPHDKALVVINKFGRNLPPERITVPAGDNQYKGVQEEVRGPGRYFLNPVFYDWDLVDLVEIPAGDPNRWEFDAHGNLKVGNTVPMVGLVTLKEGKSPPSGQEVVEPEFKGIQREVLTPGTYKINPHRYEVTLVPAVVVPPGSVGVVTRLVGEIGPVLSRELTVAPGSKPAEEAFVLSKNRLAVGPTERGILKDVLQPGVYYLNPRMVKVTVVPVGYDSITLEAPQSAIRFFSSDGYQVEADFTVIWGRTPLDAPNIVANIGNVDQIEQNVISPAMKAACQNLGAKYSAIQLIQGETRSEFQNALENSLKEQVASRDVHVLLALIRNIAIKDKSGKDATEGLLATIQRANIEIERDLTNKQKTETAKVQAELEQALKLVDVAKEMVAADTNVKVANILAEGKKQAAEIDAQREVEAASIQLQVSLLDAQRTEILGKANAEVEQLKNEAEAQGAKLLVEALGSPEAYNKYIFAKNFRPKELRLIFAGPGTFWTDLKSFQDVGASKLLQQSQPQKR